MKDLFKRFPMSHDLMGKFQMFETFYTQSTKMTQFLGLNPYWSYQHLRIFHRTAKIFQPHTLHGAKVHETFLKKGYH
jgi:hypothetical protein